MSNVNYPKIENQDEVLREICLKNADKAAIHRLDVELEAIKETNMAGIILCYKKVFEKLKIKQYQFSNRGCCGNSLVAHLCGFSNVNPIEYKLDPSICFGLVEYKELDIDINLGNNINVQNIIDEFEYIDEIYKVVQASVINNNNKIAKSPFSYFIIPKINGYSENDYGRVIEKINAFDYHENKDYYRIDLFKSKSIALIEELAYRTSIDPLSIETDDKDVLEYLEHANDDIIYKGICDFDNEIVMKMIKMAKPKNFNDLVKINSLSHGVDFWNNNVEDLIKNNILTLHEIPANRDDIFDFLINKGFDYVYAFWIAECVRRGRGISTQNEQINKMLIEHNIPQWFIDMCNKIKFAFPKAHAISNTLVAWRLLWYKIHYNEIFNDVFNEYE